MKIVVCLYRFYFFVYVLKCSFASNSYKLTKVLMEGDGKHYEVSLFLDNALCSDYRIVIF